MRGRGYAREDERSAKLFGAADALRETLGYPRESRDLALQEPYLSSARLRLDESTWEVASAEGRAMTGRGGRGTRRLRGEDHHVTERLDRPAAQDRLST